MPPLSLASHIFFHDDCSSLESLVASVTRERKTDVERVCFYCHHACLSEAADGVGALKMLNVYGWSDPGHTPVDR